MLRIPQSYIDELLEGDWALHDVTTEGMGLKGEYVVTAWPKETGIVAGIEIAERVFKTVGLRTEMLYGDGDHAFMHSPILRAWGTPEQLHATYKVAQCVMEYSTGIARRTHEMVSIARDRWGRIQVAGTRKHFPGTKPIVYAAVRAAGGIVHRYGLSDSVLVFEQHRVFCPSPDAAVARLKRSAPERKIAVEVDSIEEGLRYAAAGADIIQCERFAPETVAEFRRALHEKYPNVVINVAGGVTALNATEYARAGADVLVTSWPYFGKPFDVKMRFSCPNPGACE